MVMTLALALAGCASGTDTGTDTGTGTGTDTGADARQQTAQHNAEQAAALAGTLTVFAASSLQEPFDELAEVMMRTSPELEVRVVYDGSSTLAAQITEGAPADVFASADESTMKSVADLSLVTMPEIFADNTLRIAVAPGNPLGIESLADLAGDDVITVLCAPKVPCGAASQALLDRAGVRLVPASEEQNVNAVVTRVAEGVADAGLVYATDVAGNPGRIEGVLPEGSGSVVNRYAIGVIAEGDDDSSRNNVHAAQAFVDLVLSPTGQALLAAHGFLAP